MLVCNSHFFVDEVQMKHTIGLLMLWVPIAIMAALIIWKTVHDLGYKSAAIFFGGVLFVMAWAFFSLYLINGGR